MAHSGDGGSAEEPCPARLYPTSAKWQPVQAQSATASGARQARTANRTAAGRSADGDAEGGQHRPSIRDRGLLAWHAAALSRMNAFCANGTTGVDVLRALLTASANVASGQVSGPCLVTLEGAVTARSRNLRRTAERPQPTQRG